MPHHFQTHFRRRSRAHRVEVLPGEKCPRCLGPVFFSHEPRSSAEVGFHRAFCIRCDEWLAEACEVFKCPVCWRRPYKPSVIEGRLVILNPTALD